MSEMLGLPQPVFKAANTAPLLPQTQSSVVVDLNPQEMKTKESVQPFSITEDSTSLLNKGWIARFWNRV